MSNGLNQVRQRFPCRLGDLRGTSRYVAMSKLAVEGCMSDRLTDLEVKVAFQEHTLQQLDDVLRELVDRLERTEKRLSEVEQEHRNSLAPLENPKPPHY